MSLRVPEVEHRPRDEVTDALIREALEEEQQHKKAKKGEVPASAIKKARKGQTLGEIEDEEGGPVKESMVGMAAVKRALKRKKTQADDDEIGLPADIEAFEEEEQHLHQQRRGRLKGISEEVLAAMGTDGGFAVTGFNMRQEREEGHIDEEGNYIAGKDDEETGGDAWLNSNEAQDISEKAKAAFAARQAALTAADEAPALSEAAVAAAQRDIAALLLPGESVTAGLRRLGAARKTSTAGKALGKREKQRLAAQVAAGDKKSGAVLDAAVAERTFTKLTELADLLLNAGGELDIYSHNKEQLERWAAAVLPQSTLLKGDADEDDDMFASDDDKHSQKVPETAPALAPAAPPAVEATLGQLQPQYPVTPLSGVTAETAPLAAGGRSADDSSAATAASSVDYTNWPVKELRRYLSEAGVDSSNIVEKEELVEKVKAAAEQTSACAVAAPPGYSYDASSGYFYSIKSGMYWDSRTCLFYNSTDSNWYIYDSEAGEFRLVQQEAQL